MQRVRLLCRWGYLLIAVAAIWGPFLLARSLNNRALAELTHAVVYLPSPIGDVPVRTVSKVGNLSGTGNHITLMAAVVYRTLRPAEKTRVWYLNRLVRNPLDGLPTPVHLWIPTAKAPPDGHALALNQLDRLNHWNLGADARCRSGYVVFVLVDEPPGLDIRGW